MSERERDENKMWSKIKMFEGKERLNPIRVVSYDSLTYHIIYMENCRGVENIEIEISAAAAMQTCRLSFFFFYHVLCLFSAFSSCVYFNKSSHLVRNIVYSFLFFFVAKHDVKNIK